MTATCWINIVSTFYVTHIFCVYMIHYVRFRSDFKMHIYHFFMIQTASSWINEITMSANPPTTAPVAQPKGNEAPKKPMPLFKAIILTLFVLIFFRNEWQNFVGAKKQTSEHILDVHGWLWKSKHNGCKCSTKGKSYSHPLTLTADFKQ